MNSVSETTSFDDIVDALADGQRRRLLISLARDDSRVVIDRENQVDFHGLATMNYVHLPKLADYGFIRWNETTNEVWRGPKFDTIRPLLELLEDHEDELPADWL